MPKRIKERLEDVLKNSERTLEKGIVDYWKEKRNALHENKPGKKHELQKLMPDSLKRKHRLLEEKMQFEEYENGLDTISTETTITLEHIRTLRNFAYGHEELSPKIQDLLNSGNILLSHSKVKCVSMWFECRDMPDEGSGSIYFIRNEKDTLMYFINDEDKVEEYKICFPTWIYRRGFSVILTIENGIVLNMKFETLEAAAEFETKALFVSQFAGFHQIKQIYGEFPGQQLAMCLILCTDTDRRENQLSLLRKIMEEEDENDGYVAVNISAIDLMQHFHKRLEEYVKYADRIQSSLFQKSSAIRVTKEHKSVVSEVFQDLSTFLNLLPFVRDEPMKQKEIGFSLWLLSTKILKLIDDLECCDMMHTCSEIYETFFTRFMNIATKIEEELAPFQSPNSLLSEDTVKYFYFCDENDEDDSEDDVDFMEDEKEPVEIPPSFNVIALMHSYMETHDKSKHFPKLFDKLDEILRVGNSTIFEILEKSFTKKFIEILFRCRTIHSFGDDRDLENPFRNVRIPELTKQDKLYLHTDVDMLMIAERTVFKKIFHCQQNLVFLIEILQEEMFFEKKEWMYLVEMRNSLSKKENKTKDIDGLNADFDKALNLDGDRKSDGSSSADSYEKVDFVGPITLPSEWKDYKNYLYSDLRRIKKLGGGAYGDAYLMDYPHVGNVVYKEYKHETTYEDRFKEMNMLVKLQNNANIVRLFGFCYDSLDSVDSLPVGIIMEHVERNLDNLIHKKRHGVFYTCKYNLQTALVYFKSLASAFASVHEFGYIHRDIKPENILLTYDSQIRICDLGTCSILIKTIKTERRGTYHYMSPEMIEGGVYNEKTDVYSLGMTFWEMLRRTHPFPNMLNNDIMNFVLSGARLEIGIWSEEIEDLIKGMWAHNPEERPKMRELEECAIKLLQTLPEEKLQMDIEGESKKYLPWIGKWMINSSENEW